jgi:hypothetical protein
MRIRPDRRESWQGVALFAAGVMVGLAMTVTPFGWWPLYAGLGVLVVIAALTPVKFRPWPLFVGVIPAALFAIAVPFIGLVAGGPIGLLVLGNLVALGLVVAGTLMVFDAAW